MGESNRRRHLNRLGRLRLLDQRLPGENSGDRKDRDPNYIGWHGVQDSVARRLTSQQDLFGKPFDIEETIPAPDATMFEGGSWGVISIVGAKAALEFALKHDQTERSHRVLKV